MKRKWLLLLAVVAGLGAALLIWFAGEDARQDALLDARVWDAHTRIGRAYDRRVDLARHGAPEEEIERAAREGKEANQEFERLRREQDRRRNTWHARLRAEVHRRTGW